MTSWLRVTEVRQHCEEEKRREDFCGTLYAGRVPLRAVCQETTKKTCHSLMGPWQHWSSKFFENFVPFLPRFFEGNRFITRLTAVRPLRGGNPDEQRTKDQNAMWLAYRMCWETKCKPRTSVREGPACCPYIKQMFTLNTDHLWSAHPRASYPWSSLFGYSQPQSIPQQQHPGNKQT